MKRKKCQIHLQRAMTLLSNDHLAEKNIEEDYMSQGAKQDQEDMHPEKANIVMKPEKDQIMERKVVIKSNGKKNAVHERCKKPKIHEDNYKTKEGPSK